MPPLRHVRWDRVGRIALLCVLIGIVGLYIGPALSYWSTRGEANAKREAVAALRAEHARLQARVRELSRPGTLEREARRLGYVLPGEKPYVVQDLPGG